MKLALCLILTVAFAQADDGLRLDLIVPPSEKDRFEHAEFSFWLAGASKPVRGVIIHQHGCTNASPDKHPPITGDLHWRALARKHDCALLVPMYHVKGGCDEWNDPDSGSERALFTALADFAQRSGHAELNDAPWVLWGHSGGSSWSAQMIVRHPSRVLAASFRGGCSKQFGVPEFRDKFAEVARELPLLFVWGKRESVPTSSHFVSWDPMNAMYRQLRAAGGKVARVIDPRSEHGCDDSRFMSINFFDAVLSGETKPGALVDIETLQNRALTESNLSDPELAWMPNAEFAKLWREFSEKGTLNPARGPTQVPDLKAERQVDGTVKVSWRIVPELAGGLRAICIQRDGQPWKEVALKPADFLATGRDSTPEELRAHSLVDESKEPHGYTLIFRDVGGNESPASEAVRVP